MFAPALRKFMFTAHITASLAWLGSVAAFLALALVGWRTEDAATMRAVYRASEIVTWTVIVPLCVATLVTGVIQSLGTPWGLVRHYWVIAKLLLTAGATVVLFVHTAPIGYIARAAAAKDLAVGELMALRFQLVVDAAAAIVALLAATVLSVYKPPGLTPYGWRRQRAERGGAE